MLALSNNDLRQWVSQVLSKPLDKDTKTDVWRRQPCHKRPGIVHPHIQVTNHTDGQTISSASVRLNYTFLVNDLFPV